MMLNEENTCLIFFTLDSYENHQPQNQMMNRRMRTSSSFNLGATGTNYPNHMIQRAGSNASLSS